MIDISIKQLSSLSLKELESLMDKEVIVSEKIDGVKINVKVENKSYRVFYKDLEIKREYFDGLENFEDISSSTGFAQFSKIFELLDNSKILTLPENTILFFEFQMRKPTLTRQYKNTGNLYLLSYNSNFNIIENQKLSKELHLHTPKVLFQGFLRDFYKEENISKILSNKETEGVVINFLNENICYKITQVDQYDKALRRSIKKEMMESPEYYENVYSVLKERGYFSNFSQILDCLEYFPASYKLSKVQQTETILEYSLRFKQTLDSKSALILGKFRILTKAHLELFKKALENPEVENLYVCIVYPKNDKKSILDLRLEILHEELEKLFQEYPRKNIFVLNHQTGNLLSIFRKIKINPTFLYCGSDRVKSYTTQLKRSFTKILEIPRTEDDISSTKAEKLYFSKNLNGFKELVSDSTFKNHKRLFNN